MEQAQRANLLLFLFLAFLKMCYNKTGLFLIKSMKNKLKSVSKILPILILAVFIGIAVLTPVHQAWASGGWLSSTWDKIKWGANFVNDPLGYIENIVPGILYFLFSLALKFLNYFVNIGAWAINIFLDPQIYHEVLGTSATPSPAIDQGWIICRDLSNLFFVLLLLGIAFATIFRIQAYSAKALLPKFILAIFLINFSKVIATIVIDFGQILMFQFIDWMGAPFGPSGSSGGAMSSLTAIPRQFVQRYSVGFRVSYDDVGGAFFAAAFTLALGIIYLILAVFLLIRLVVLGLLIVLSPFAFMAVILPGTRSYSSKWWSGLFKYVLFGPIFVFFIYLAGEMGRHLMNVGSAPTYPGITSPELFTNSALGESPSIYSSVIIYFVKGGIVMGMLLMSVFMTKSMGIIGASTLIGGTAGLGLMGSYLWRGARYGGGKARRVGGYAGRKAGIDTRKLKSGAFGVARSASEKMSKKGGVVGRAGQMIGGTVIVKEADQKAKDRKDISNKYSDLNLKEMTGREALLAAQGEASKTVMGASGDESRSKITALVQRAIEDGVDMAEKDENGKLKYGKLISIAKSKNINTDEIAKYDPRAAEALGGKKANEYFKKHAEDGSWKKYKGHVWDKDYGNIQKEVNNDKLLRDFRKTAGKEMQEHIDKGAENYVTSTISKYTDSHGHLVGPHAEEEVKKARESVAVVTGDIRTAYGVKDASGKIEVDTDALKGSVDKLSESFKNFNTDSKKLFGQYTKGVSGLDLKGQSQIDIDSLIDGLRSNTLAVRQEAASNPILGQRIRTRGLTGEFGIGDKENKKKKEESKWDKGAGYA